MQKTQLIQSSWHACWQGLGVDAPEDELERLLARWNQPQRHYHTEQHLAECLTWAQSVELNHAFRGIVLAALFYHDAVYDPGRKKRREFLRSFLRREETCTKRICLVNPCGISLVRT